MDPIAALMLSEAVEADRRREAARRRRLLDLERSDARNVSGPTRRTPGLVAGIARLDFDRV